MITTRFAPSPTGYLHLGHAHAALVAWRRARDGGGRFLLRIEDIDATRCLPEFIEAAMEDLRWLGVDWDGLRVQSAHLGEYRVVLDGLAARGLTYPCFCTRTEIAREIEAAGGAPHGPDGPVYPGICRGLSEARRQARLLAGEPHAIRLDMARALAEVGPLGFHDAAHGHVACRPERFGDVVLGRKDVPTSYHLCVTHDDATQGVTLVTRGADLLAATDVHRVLQALMGWPTPDYEHHALLTDGQGRRLAKRDKAATLRSLRAAGMLPGEVREMAGA
jgi:glutamyl-Q tRNA(Asp) synthetase